MAQASFSCPSGNSPSGVLTPCTHSPLLCSKSLLRGFSTACRAHISCAATAGDYRTYEKRPHRSDSVWSKSTVISAVFTFTHHKSLLLSVAKVKVKGYEKAAASHRADLLGFDLTIRYHFPGRMSTDEGANLAGKFMASPHNCVCGLRPIFCPIRAVIKGGNTYSIPALL